MLPEPSSPPLVDRAAAHRSAWSTSPRPRHSPAAHTSPQSSPPLPPDETEARRPSVHTDTPGAGIFPKRRAIPPRRADRTSPYASEKTSPATPSLPAPHPASLSRSTTPAPTRSPVPY